MKRFFRLPTLALALVMCSILPSVGCKSQAYVQHPGSVNIFDSQAYDWVLTTKAVIDSAKTDLANGAWSATIAAKVKLILNDALIPAYNVLDTAYLDYHAAAATNPNASTAALQTAINNAGTQTQALTSAKAGN